MASLRECSSRIIDDVRSGIPWIIIWKVGRSWNVDTLYLEYNERSCMFEYIEPEDLEYMRRIMEEDGNAAIVNTYYCNMGPLDDEMTVSTLSDGIRYQYYQGSDRIRNLF